MRLCVRTNALHFNKFQRQYVSVVQTTFGAFNGFLVEQTFILMCVRAYLKCFIRKCQFCGCRLDNTNRTDSINDFCVYMRMVVSAAPAFFPLCYSIMGKYGLPAVIKSDLHGNVKSLNDFSVCARWQSNLNTYI